jgi:RHS repeat-associated protein
MAVVTDTKVAVRMDNANVSYYLAHVISATDYYAFGSPVPGRSFAIGSYRFGFQGMEKDNEISGFGSSYYTEFCQYDPRLGRWFSVDPTLQPWMSPYCAMDNNPISFVDPFGLMARDSNKDKSKDKTPDMGETETVKVEGEPVKVKYKKWKEGQWLAYGRDVKKKDFKQWKRGEGGSSESTNSEVEHASWWQFSEGFMDNAAKAMRWSLIQTGRELITTTVTGANDSWMGTLKGMEQVHKGVQNNDIGQAASGMGDIADNLSRLNPQSRILRTILGLVNAADMLEQLMGDSPILQSKDFNVEDPSSFEGADPKDVEEWLENSGDYNPKEPSKKDGGYKFVHKKNFGEQIRIMPGKPSADDMVHRGPYAVFNRHGILKRIPLKGNPALNK